jgi:hypothetical protein
MYNKKLEEYDQLVAKCSRFKRKGKTMPYTSANGYMFSLFNKDAQIGIRFSEVRKKELIETLETSIYKSYGAVMKGYVLIPELLLKDTDLIVALLNESFDYVMSLPPK